MPKNERNTSFFHLSSLAPAEEIYPPLSGHGSVFLERLHVLYSQTHAFILAQARQEAQYRTHFLAFPLAFGIGILLYFTAQDEPYPLSAPFCAALFLVFMLKTSGYFQFLWRLMLMMALGFSAASIRTYRVASPFIEKEGMYEVKGFIESMERVGNRFRITLQPSAIEGVPPAKWPYRLRIGIRDGSAIQSGDFVALKAQLSPPSDASLPGGYDFRRDAFFKSIGGVGFSASRVLQLEPPAPPSWDLRWRTAIDRARNALTERIATAIGGDRGGLGAALITGKRGLISENANDALRVAGLYHIVSISGLHMVLAAGALFWSLRALLAAFPPLVLRYPIKKIAAFCAMFGATAYCVFSGAEVATERSLYMCLFMLGAILVDKRALALRNVAISALIVLTLEPEALLGPSFQMSYAAVAALIAAHQVWQVWKPEAERLSPPSFAEKWKDHTLWALPAILGSTIVATLATAPFVAHHFYRINPFGLIGNTFGLPLVSLVVMPAAFIGMLLVPFGLDYPVWVLMGYGIEGILFISHKVAQIDYATIFVSSMRSWVFGGLIIALLWFVCFRTYLRFFAVIPLVFVVLLQVFSSSNSAGDILIHPKGKMALVTGANGAYRLLTLGAIDRFTLSQWLPAMGDARTPHDPSLREGVSCDKEGCTTRLIDGAILAFTPNLAALYADCQRADLVITPLADLKICEGTTRVTLPHLEAFGAIRLRWQQGKVLAYETSLTPLHQRPWRKRGGSQPVSSEKPNDTPFAFALKKAAHSPLEITKQHPKHPISDKDTLNFLEAEDDPLLESREAPSEEPEDSQEIEEPEE